MESETIEKTEPTAAVADPVPVKPSDRSSAEVPLETSVPGQPVAADTQKDEAAQAPDACANLKTDLDRLESMNWLNACLVQLRQGKHPDLETDALLKRNFGFTREMFNGPYPVRLIVTWAMIFVFCAIAWWMIHAFTSLMGYTGFIRELSGLMVTLLAAVWGISISHPKALIDEKLLEEAGKEKLKEMRRMNETQETRQGNRSEN